MSSELLGLLKGLGMCIIKGPVHKKVAFIVLYCYYSSSYCFKVRGQVNR